MLSIRRFAANQDGFNKEFTDFLTANEEHEDDVSLLVRDVIQKIRADGDGALLQFTQKFDRLTCQNASELQISHDELQQALASIDQHQRDSLQQAHERVKEYAEHQRLQSWDYRDEHGSLLGQRVTPLDRVGVYVPGGTAAYPSSVLMNAVPAKVAGVPEVIMVAPTPDGKVNSVVLAAAHIAGVDRVFCIGGSQAVAALAYGTETVPRVDKIVGPGNIFVATAKRMVFGQVGIDMIAGPSEVLVICDESANPEWVAMDLFSQAEHDANARAILLSPSQTMLDQVEAAMNALVDDMSRADIIRSAIERCGALVQVRDLQEAADIANGIAPEHLELSVAEPDSLVTKIKHAGAIFVGHHSPEVFGDYCAGPNHVLPTAMTARFSSPLGVYDFQKRSTVLRCSAEGARKLSRVASVLAHSEGLTAHARSAEYRANYSED